MPAWNARNAANIAALSIAPWAKLMMCSTPYTSVSPTAIKA